MAIKTIAGDALERLRKMRNESVHCCVTSPPYYGLRDYGVDGQIGLEETPDDYVANLVDVFREVRRVLRDDGTFWLNLGDSYAANRPYQVSQSKHRNHDYKSSGASRVPDGLKPKDLIGIPWMVAFALRADGWYLRDAIVWHKPRDITSMRMRSLRDPYIRAIAGTLEHARQQKLPGQTKGHAYGQATRLAKRATPAMSGLSPQSLTPTLTLPSWRPILLNVAFSLDAPRMALFSTLLVVLEQPASSLIACNAMPS